MSVREDSVLQPRKAADVNPDNWAQFNIKKIKVTSQKTGSNVSLLSAHQNNPVRVCGRLEKIDQDLIHRVRDKKYQDKLVELDNVTTYAFAQYDDGTSGFWAAGKAGWFEVQSPATSYKTTYNKMNEAVSIFYMLADRLRKYQKTKPGHKTKDLNATAKWAFQDYFEQRKDPTCPADVEEAQAIFDEHREFLMTSMLEGQDGLDWTEAPILNYFKSKFPDEYDVIAARVLRLVPASHAKLEAAAKDSKNGRDSSMKRKSQSPHDELTLQNKRHKRKAAQQAESRIYLLPKGLVVKTPQEKHAIDLLSSDEEDISNINVVGRKHKSVLQPSGGKYSKKAAAHRKGLRATQGPGDSLNDENSDERAHSERSPITTIRNAKDLELLTNPLADRSSSEATPSPKFLPRKYLELKVVEYDLPSMEPQGSGDLWTCVFDGCFHRVHEASSSEGKMEVKEHFKAHATQAQEKIDLVLNESRPYLPVNNLMRRLQAFAPEPGTVLGPDSLERKFSAPIHRLY